MSYNNQSPTTMKTMMMRRRNDSNLVAVVFTNLLLLALLSSSRNTNAYGYIIGPGCGLISKDFNVEVVIFEHTEMGTGGLVLNCPTPLTIGSLNIPRFHAFEELPLMLGNGMILEQEEGEEEEEDENDIYSNNSIDNNRDDIMTNNVCLGEVSPWFWIHNMENLPGSYELGQASGPLYMGGNIEEATKRLQEQNINPRGRFKFFRKYMSWKAGELEEALDRGEWTAIDQDPEQALKPVFIPKFKLQ